MSLPIAPREPPLASPQSAARLSSPRAPLIDAPAAECRCPHATPRQPLLEAMGWPRAPREQLPWRRSIPAKVAYPRCESRAPPVLPFRSLLHPHDPVRDASVVLNPLMFTFPELPNAGDRPEIDSHFHPDIAIVLGYINRHLWDACV